jgi:lipoprotein-anchoring transpeptidase ErfK/SrfK
MKHAITMTIAALALAAPAAGQRIMASQSASAQTRERATVEVARAMVESRIVPGAPYAADAVTESVQVLSDGNRIARRMATRIYRDSEGRTRREQLTASGEVQSVSISDPVSGSMYVLDPATRTAHRNGVIMSGGRGGFATAGVPAGSDGTVTATRTPDGGVTVATSAETVRRREVETQAAAASGGGGGVAVGSVSAGGRGRGSASAGVAYPPEAATMQARTIAGGTANTEDLGRQVIEGILAAGTRTTTTIPAGTIGNEQAIQILSEQWFSEDLKVLVQTKHSDPRSGQTIYRLTNIVQTEPARSLFEVPADYTLKDSVIRRQSPMQPHD